MIWVSYFQLLIVTALLRSNTIKALRFTHNESEAQNGAIENSPIDSKTLDEYAWIREYEAFHQSQRLKPGARYIVHRTDVRGKGLGDRLRSMMFTARLAYASSRVVLFSWDQPFDVSEFFTPASDIDWRAAGTGEIVASSQNS
jgi:PIN domain nuclease of toxin-antitoxin system